MKPEDMSAPESSLANMPISSPAKLRALIAKLKESVVSGEMQQYWPTDAPFATEIKISDVNENGPWPADYIEWYFLSVANNRRYQLSVETYHGTGGHWKLLVD